MQNFFIVMLVDVNTSSREETMDFILSDVKDIEVDNDESECASK